MIRRLLLVLHRWIALVTGIVLLALAGSGAVLVFEGSIDRALNPRLYHATPTNATLPLDELVRRAEAAFPGSPVAMIIPSLVPGRAWNFSTDAGTVFVDPWTGTVNGRRTAAESRASLARRMHELHVTLLAGDAGRKLVGIACLAALFLTITGIVLWWPDKLIRIRAGASWKRINFDLHHVLGILSAPLLLLITASGAAIHYSQVGVMLRGLDGAPVRAPAPRPVPAGAARASFDSLAATAYRTLPGAAITLIMPGNSTSPATIAMRFPEDRTPGGRSRVLVDPAGGTVLRVISTREAGPGTRIDNLKRSLHTGDVLGRPTSALWLVATLVMFSQGVTGLLMWWNARRARRAPIAVRAVRAST